MSLLSSLSCHVLNTLCETAACRRFACQRPINRRVAACHNSCWEFESKHACFDSNLVHSMHTSGVPALGSTSLHGVDAVIGVVVNTVWSRWGASEVTHHGYVAGNSMHHSRGRGPWHRCAELQHSRHGQGAEQHREMRRRTSPGVAKTTYKSASQRNVAAVVWAFLEEGGSEAQSRAGVGSSSDPARSGLVGCALASNALFGYKCLKQLTSGCTSTGPFSCLVLMASLLPTYPRRTHGSSATTATCCATVAFPHGFPMCGL